MSLYEAAAEIVLAALDLAGIARDQFIEEKTKGNAALNKEVLSLLEAHSRSEGFLEQPTTIGAFKILGLLGEGGMGTVYLAEDTRLGRKVALKAIARQYSNDEHSRERLRREARAAAALVHPGIAVVYALEEIDGSLFIVSEHIQGETLRDAIADGPLPLGDVLSIGRSLAEALAAAHDRGVVHRDLKPENVMRTRDGAVKILDFGLAKTTAPDEPAAGEPAAPALTAVGAVFGTPGYMSPEQLRGETATASADIFALGVLLAEISSGRHPFGGERGTGTMARILTAEPDLADVPTALRPVVAGAIAKASADRFRSAHEVRAAIDTVARGETPRLADHRAEFWWWQFHQAGACIYAAILLIGVWFTSKLPEDQADYVLVGAVLGAASSTTLRLFNWFAARMLPGAPGSRAIAIGARVGDEILALATFMAGFYERSTHPVAAALLMASAVVLTIISIVIEPQTARAAKRY